MARRYIKILLASVLLALIATGGTLGYGYATYTMPGQGTIDRVVVLKRGQGLKEIAAQLAREGVISNQLVFRAGVRFGGFSHNLKAGEFLFPADASMRDVTRILSKGAPSWATNGVYFV